MIVRRVNMGRVWVCMLLCYSQIQYIHMVAQKQTLVLWGLNCANNQRLRWDSRGGSRTGPRDPGLLQPWIPGKDLGPG
jgi:hypothetical protein